MIRNLNVTCYMTVAPNSGQPTTIGAQPDSYVATLGHSKKTLVIDENGVAINGDDVLLPDAWFCAVVTGNGAVSIELAAGGQTVSFALASTEPLLLKLPSNTTALTASTAIGVTSEIEVMLAK